MCNLVLVDDDQNQLFLHRILFSEKDSINDIETFQDPNHALDYIKQNHDSSNDVIIVDLNMPQMTAWEFLDNINSNLEEHKKKKINLFVASYTSNPRDIEKANNHHLVTKFIPKDHLISEITSYAIAHKISLNKST